MALFEAVEQKPPSKVRRYLVTALVLLILLGGTLWWMLRFHSEKVTILHFMNAVTSRQYAAVLANMRNSFTPLRFNDFVEDWGPAGYYGPVKSFHLDKTEHHPGASGVELKLELSPFQPFPDGKYIVKQSKTKEVTLWVEFKDQSISYPPY